MELVLKIVVCVAVTVIQLSVVHSYPEGPPLSSCYDMYPSGHDVDSQTTASIVTFTVTNSSGMTATSYTAAETFSVTVSTTDPADATLYFVGLFVQAQKASCAANNMPLYTPHGTFSFDPSNSFLKTMDCNSATQSAISQKTSTRQVTQTFFWTAPNPTVGHLYLQATVVKNLETFWTGMESGFLLDASDSADPQYCVVRNTFNTGSSVTWTPLLVLLAFSVVIAKTVCLF